MVGSPAMQVLAESWLKGVRDWDAATAFDAAYATATGPVSADGRGGIGSYVTKGYVPAEEGSVSDTLEYAWNDHALMLWAEAMDRPEAGALAGQADNWKNVWSAEHGFNTARYADGSFAFRRADLWETWFVEGNAWHYLWYAPFDVAGMIDLQHGGDTAAFIARLEQYWADVEVEEDDVGADTFYWHGNEPVMHVAFLGALAGHPAITAEASRLVLATRYDTSTAGLDGNDDAGTLSAWYLWASTGLFPVAGTDVLSFSSPLFERVEIDRAPGQTIVVRAPGVSAERRYLASWRLGEAEQTQSWIRHGDLLDAGELVLELSEARDAWGAAAE
jgi:predicted alpha-1,2-mannosidase